MYTPGADGQTIEVAGQTFAGGAPGSAGLHATVDAPPPGAASSSPHAAAKSTHATLTLNPSTRVYMVCSIRTKAPAKTRGCSGPTLHRVELIQILSEFSLSFRASHAES
jgi:hypothetical protein